MCLCLPFFLPLLPYIPLSGVCCLMCWLTATVSFDHSKCGQSKLRCAVSIKYTVEFKNFSSKM